MNIGLTTDLDTSRFVSMLGDLQTLSGKDFKTVLLSQTAAILKFCIKHTRAASRGKIIESISKRRSRRFQFPGGEVISLSKRHPGHINFLDKSTWDQTGWVKSNGAKGGKTPPIVKNGMTWHDMTDPERHWSDARWTKYQVLLAQMKAMQGSYTTKDGKRQVTVGKAADLAAALGSRGLAKHSWLQIAEAIGLASEVDAPAWVKSAKPQDGKSYQNGTAKFALEAAAAYIEMRNDYPAAIRMNCKTLINYAIISRAKSFEREVELGVFRDIKTRAARYPGLFVSNS
jgi:hypothetical protein